MYSGVRQRAARGSGVPPCERSGSKAPLALGSELPRELRKSGDPLGSPRPARGAASGTGKGLARRPSQAMARHRLRAGRRLHHLRSSA
mmetsp:Transcript_51550/g.149716  ORF Transcript_51550/g.149716 Transcript_51550/m.149716 type:complete len:88 (+) Transcript_51550:574-837(+)